MKNFRKKLSVNFALNTSPLVRKSEFDCHCRNILDTALFEKKLRVFEETEETLVLKEKLQGLISSFVLTRTIQSIQ